MKFISQVIVTLFCRFPSLAHLAVLMPLLTHWGRVTHICVSKQTIIGSDNGVLSSRRQIIIWTNVEILLIRTLGTNFSKIFSEIHKFSFRKIHFKMSSGKWRPSCLGLSVFTITVELRHNLDMTHGNNFFGWMLPILTSLRIRYGQGIWTRVCFQMACVSSDVFHMVPPLCCSILLLLPGTTRVVEATFEPAVMLTVRQLATNELKLLGTVTGCIPWRIVLGWPVQGHG